MISTWFQHFIVLLVVLAVLIFFIIKNIKSNGSLEHRLTLAFIFVSIISLMPIIIILNRNIENIMLKRFGNEAFRSVEVISEQIGSDIAMNSRTLDKISKNEMILKRIVQTTESQLSGLLLYERQKVFLEREDKWKKSEKEIYKFIKKNSASNALDKFIKKNPENIQILLTDRFGALVGFSGKKPGSYYYGNDNWWLKAYENRYSEKWIAGNIKIDLKKNISTLDLYHPIFIPHTEAFRGMIRTRLNIRSFKSLRKIKFAGTVDIVSISNVIIFSSNPSRVGELYEFDLSKRKLKEKNWNTFHRTSGETVVLSSSNIIFPSYYKYSGNIGLKVSIHQPVDKIVKDIKFLVNIAMFAGLLIFILATIIGRIFAKQIANPIRDLAVSVSKFSEHKPLKVNYKMLPVEFKVLLASFNDMTNRLKSVMTNLRRESEIRWHSVQELEGLKYMLSSIINSMPSIIIAVDNSCKIMLWNTEAENASGVKVENAIGKPLKIIFPELKNEIQSIKDAIKHKRIIKHENKEFKIKGHHKYINVMIYPLFVKKRKGAVVRLDDMTEMFVKEELIKQSQKMETVGSLASGLAHDFNNILGIMVGTISLINYHIKNDKSFNISSLEKNINILEQSSDRARGIVQQLLALSRKQEMVFEPLDLNLSINNVAKICLNSFDKSIKIETIFYDKPAMVNADQTQIEQVLLNFCINSAHAMTVMRSESESWGGELTIMLEKMEVDEGFITLFPEAEQNCFWALTIKDTGVGINKENLSKIFTPFYTTKSKKYGTGLGLSVVYNIIQGHKGFIKVYSEENIGTSFIIYLPLLRDEDIKEKYVASEFENIPKGEGTILIVDDEKLLNDTAAAILENCGYETISAGNGKEGLEIYLNHGKNIKAVLLDMIMPEMSGKETYIKLKAINPDIKVLLSSGFRQDTRVIDIINLGVDGFIQKPYTLKALAEAMDKVINS